MNQNNIEMNRNNIGINQNNIEINRNTIEIKWNKTEMKQNNIKMNKWIIITSKWIIITSKWIKTTSKWIKTTSKWISCFVRCFHDFPWGFPQHLPCIDQKIPRNFCRNTSGLGESICLLRHCVTCCAKSSLWRLGKGWKNGGLNIFSSRYLWNVWKMDENGTVTSIH
jgi:hypothetical protein